MKISKDEVMATGRPRFMGWDQVPEGHKTKTQWGEEGMKLKESAEADAYVYVRGHPLTHLELYAADSVIPKKTPPPGKAYPLTPENLGAALFEINKAAKRRRDSAQAEYDRGHHGLAGARKRQKELFYEIKDRVLRNAVDHGLATFAGFHVKHHTVNRRVREEDNLEDDHVDDEEFDELEDFNEFEGKRTGGWVETSERRETAMACYAIGGFRFHTILEDFPEDVTNEVKDLGDWISGATPKPILMTLKDAEATLKAYLDEVAA